MNPEAYHIISETTEDRFGEVDSLEEAVRIARAVARESQVVNRFPSNTKGGSFGNWR